jgi:2-(1,2-epoxy-1,2-dihydrophenyl)acetyl-CoA isomerase
MEGEAVVDIGSWETRGLAYEVDGHGVAWLRLNRPEKRNAIDRPLRNALLEAFHEVSEAPQVKVAVITGTGTAFSSGADITQEGGPIEVPPERRSSGPNGPRDDGLLYGWSRLMERIWRSETPFIASVNGAAVGAGCQLALACDLILAAEDASFWEIFVRLGLPLEGGAAWLLTRSLSLARAKELALYGEPLPAREAERWGLINRCVPATELETTTREWAHRLAAITAPDGRRSMAAAPDLSRRVGHIKGQLNAAWEQTMQQSFVTEVTLLGLVGTGPASIDDAST